MRDRRTDGWRETKRKEEGGRHRQTEKARDREGERWRDGERELERGNRVNNRHREGRERG